MNCSKMIFLILGIRDNKNNKLQLVFFFLIQHFHVTVLTFATYFLSFKKLSYLNFSRYSVWLRHFLIDTNMSKIHLKIL